MRDFSKTLDEDRTEITEKRVLRNLALRIRAHRARIATLEGLHGERAYPELIERSLRLVDELEREIREAITR